MDAPAPSNVRGTALSDGGMAHVAPIMPGLSSVRSLAWRYLRRGLIQGVAVLAGAIDGARAPVGNRLRGRLAPLLYPQSCAGPRLSAFLAPRSPIGRLGPVVVSVLVCASISEFNSAPIRMM